MPNSPSPSLVAQRRALIDLIAETRSRSIRVALFGTQIARPDPNLAQGDRAAQLGVLLDTVRWIDRVHKLLHSGHDPWDQVPPHLARWLAGFARAQPAVVASVHAMLQASQAVAEAAKHDPAGLNAALRSHYEARRNGFMDLITDFCDTIWASIDQERENAVAEARETRKAIQKTLTRLETIGKHVRLVSLNAAVEATRAGDAGKGLGIIATEFKILAEEIQTLATTANGEIRSITPEA